MKVKYTRQQIQEAIKFQSKKLNKINESSMSLIDDLLTLFDKNKLFSSCLDYILSQEDANNIYKILNTHIFDNQLSPQNILCIDETQMKHIYNSLKYEANPHDFYAQYFPDLRPSTNKLDLPIIGNELFIFNVSNCPVNVSFAISAICREMIHKYDILKGTLRKNMKDYFENGKPYNEHSTPDYNEKSDYANNIGLTVIPDGASIELKKLCELSAMRLSRAYNKLLSDAELNNIDISALINYKSTAKVIPHYDGSYTIAFGN